MPPVNRLCRAAALIARIATVAGLAALAAGAPAATPAENRADLRWAGRAQLGFQHLTGEHGLPNEVSVALAQDAAGYLWVGTAGGLARWDGYQFRSFRFVPGEAGSLPDNLIQTLHADRAGRLWVGTSAGGLARHDPATQRFVTVAAGPQGLGHVSVRAIADDGEGGLWVGTDGGLDHLDGRSGAVTALPLGAASGLTGDRVVALLLDRRGRLWAGSNRGLFRRDAGAARFEAVPLPHAGSGTPQPEVLREDSQGRVWIGTNRAGVFVIAPGGPARALQEHEPGSDAGDGPPLAAQRIGAIVEARPGEIWIATLGQGIVVVDAASGATRRLRHRAGMAASLVDDTVRGLLLDRSGLLWAATHGGLSRTDPRTAGIQTIVGERGTLSARREYDTLMAHGDGRLWLGTLNDGVEIVTADGRAAPALRPDAARPEQALPPDVVSGMAESEDGSVFIGTYRGLYHAAADARSVRRVHLPGREPTAGTGPLLRDGALLWVGGLSDGLWRLALRKGAAPAQRVQPASALTDRRITALARGPGGELWIGTRNGLNRYDPVRGTLQRLPAGAPPQALAAGFVSSLLLDRRGQLWVGTYGGGIHRLLAGTADAPVRWQRYGREQGLPDENVNALLEDDEGRIWASTEDGLALLDPARGRAQALRRAEGVVFLSYWTGAATRTPGGGLLFGASGGLTLVRPAPVAPSAWLPPVVATEVRVGGQPVAPPAAGSGEVLRVPAQANQLVVQYAALDFSSPERNRYEHKLEGYDADWQPSDARQRLATYANLPPGDYRLLLRGSNREGLFAEAALALPLTVLPAWHQSWSFRAALGGLALAALWALVQLRTRVLLARRRELQQLVDARTAELRAVTQALEQKQAVLERASIIDPLTGLHNRRFLAEEIEGTLAASWRRAQGAPGHAPAAGVHDTDTLFFLIDADRFKRINDDLGHAAGDTVLVQLGLRLQAAMRESDFVVRWGGEEFLAVARDTDRARADELAERIRAAVAEQPFRLDDGRTLDVSCSVGHAAWPFVPAQATAVDWQGVVNLADIGLRAAKRLGRNAWVGVHATPATQPAGLPARATAAPLRALQAGEIAVTSSRPQAELAAALREG